MNKIDQIIDSLNSFYVEALKDPFTIYVIFACLIMIIIAVATAIVRKINKRRTINKIKNKIILEPVVIEVGKDKEEIETVEVKDEKVDLAEVLAKMEQSLKTEVTAIDEFEQMQEEKSIISYQELLKTVNKQDEEPVVANPISLFEDEIKIEPTIDEEPKKFKNSEFISPIYGKVERTVNLETKKGPVNQNEAFLNILKDFRKNLD